MSIQALPAKLNDRIVSYLGHSPIKEKEIKRLSDFYTHEISLLQRLGFLTGTDQIDGDFPYPVEFYLKLIPNTITSLALKDILSSMEWGEEEKIVALVSSSATQPQLVCKHEHNEALHIHSLPSPFISCTKESLLTFDPEISKNDFSVLIISFPKFSTTVIRCHVLTTREQPLFNLDALAFTFEKLPSDSPYKSFLKEANQQPFGIKAIFLHEILKLISEAGQASQATRDAAQNLQKILDTHSMKTSTSLEPDPPLSASSPSLPPPPPPPPPPPSSLPLPLLSPSSASMLRAPVGKPAPAGNAVSKQLSHTDIIKNDSTIAKELGYEQQNMGTYNAAKRYAQKYSIGVPSSNEWQRLKREATQNGYQTGALV
ncbi:MAG: hypothetical protein LBG98_01780, partial [Puniceicoccales bacterium]|nr:hypothetical protein [Puniceicoccales bacterium]